MSKNNKTTGFVKIKEAIPRITPRMMQTTKILAKMFMVLKVAHSPTSVRDQTFHAMAFLFGFLGNFIINGPAKVFVERFEWGAFNPTWSCATILERIRK